MRLRQTRARARTGFTMVELMVVILIGAVLMSLLVAAVSKALAKGKQVRNHNDIQQLGAALENFKSKFGFYPPSRIRLCEKYAFYNLTGTGPNWQLDADSVPLLMRMFPRIDPNNWNSNPASTVGGIDWNGNGGIDIPLPPGTAFVPGTLFNGSWELEGDECLVFFLGGIPNSTAGPIGFSTNPGNPSPAAPLVGSVTNPGDRLGPFFEFKTERLVNTTGAGPIHSGSPAFYSYVDTYSQTDGKGLLLAGAPYAYFSSYKSANGYWRHQMSATGQSDCSVLGVKPYLETPAKFWNPNTYQLISAGADGLFGAGNGVWTPATAGNIYPEGTQGRDDQSNFYDGPLGFGN